MSKIELIKPISIDTTSMIEALKMPGITGAAVVITTSDKAYSAFQSYNYAETIGMLEKVKTNMMDEWLG